MKRYMIKIVSLIALLTFSISADFIFGQATGAKTVISGQITNNTFSKINLYVLGQQKTFVTSAETDKDGKFVMEPEVKQANFYRLEFDASTYVMLVVQPGENIKVSADAVNMQSSLSISGSPMSEQVLNNSNKIGQFKHDMDSLNKVYNSYVYAPNGDSIVKAITAAYLEIQRQQMEYTKNFLESNPGSLACLFLTDRNTFSIDDYFSTYEKVDSALFQNYPDNYYVGGLHQQVKSVSGLATGAEAPEIDLPDTNGIKIKLSSLRGKIVVIDFWASWCGPCRKESPNMVKLYKDFKSKGLEIYGVSLDKTKQPWVAAIKSDKLSWIHVSDLKFWDSEGAKAYGVGSIPHTVLLDKDGKILAKGLRGEELYNKVGELLK